MAQRWVNDMLSSMNKRQKSLLAGYVIVLIVFLLLFVIIPFTVNAAVIWQFLFGILSICLGYGITYYAFKSTYNIRSKVYGFPIAYIGWIYTGVQIALSFIIFIINKFIDTPAWIGAVLSILLLAIALIGVIGTDNARDIIADIDTKEEILTKPIKTFRLDIASLCDSCTDENAKELLEKLSDKLRYSDPVSSDALADIEYRITQGIEEIKEIIDKAQYASVVDKINAVDRMVDDRNRRCKAEKGL